MPIEQPQNDPRTIAKNATTLLFGAAVFACATAGDKIVDGTLTRTGINNAIATGAVAATTLALFWKYCCDRNITDSGTGQTILASITGGVAALNYNAGFPVAVHEGLSL